MKVFGNLAVALAVLLILAAIWTPAHWWQLLLSGLIAFIIGAVILGSATEKAKR